MLEALSSIAVDSSDNAHIAYYYAHGTFDGDLKYAYNDGSKWHIETVDSEGDVGLFTSIAIGSSDNPHISYVYFYDGVNWDLKYAHYDSSIWHIETVDGNEVGISNSLVLDSNDNPHISYPDWVSISAIKHAYYDSTWHIDTVDSIDVGWYTSIALDSSDKPHISYYDDNNGALKHAYYDGIGWNIETVDSEGDVGKSNCIGLDSDDNPHISYWDETNSDLKYAYGVPGYALTITATSGGTTYPPPETYIYAANSVVEVNAIPDANYAFDHWELDGNDVGSDKPYLVVMVSDHTLHAVFVEINYDLTITADSGGTTEPHPGTYAYEVNSAVEVNAIPDECDEFDHWELDGNDVGSTNPYVVVMDSNHTLHAVFIQLGPYDLTITVTSYGTTDPTPGIYTYGCGSSVEVTAIPDEFYVFDHWELDGNDVGSVNPFSLLMDSNHTLHAVFLRNADLNGNCYVDWTDLGIFADWWLASDCCELNWCDGADLDESNDVTWDDFATFACQWLKCITDCTCTDMDGDGYANPASPCCLFQELDCNDTDPNTNPGAEEICDDSIDNDCDGLTDYADPDCGPECWKCPRQCHGDADCLAQGIQQYWVSTNDMAILEAAWLTSYPDPNYNPCADFTRDANVDDYDLAILLTWYNKPDVPSDCEPGGVWPPEP